jgi:hypothetical protein
MRTLLATLALIPASLTLLPGCPLGCGAYDGDGDTVYRSANGESVMLCSNGGVSAMLSTGIVEGRYEYSDEIHTSNPETGARLFSFTTSPDGTATSPELGAGWSLATLDQVELDHAHIQCSDLETRAWWGTVGQTAFLPKATAFKKTASGFPTADACYEAQAAGDYPESALCEDELLACPDGRAILNQGQSISTGAYSAQFGALTVQPVGSSFFTSFSGIFSAKGTLTTVDAVWRQVPVSEMSNGAACQ